MRQISGKRCYEPQKKKMMQEVINFLHFLFDFDTMKTDYAEIPIQEVE